MSKETKDTENTAATESEQATESDSADDKKEQTENKPEGKYPDGLKVIISPTGNIITVGVQKFESDPYMESFGTNDIAEVLSEVQPVLERALARWKTSPQNPTYTRPSYQAPARTAQANKKEDKEKEEKKQPTLF